MTTSEPITEGWLRDSGFKYTMPDQRRPDFKHWVLWLDNCIDAGGDSLAIEVAFNRDGNWFCWLRSDIAHRYCRFIHLRHLTFTDELTRMIEGITGQEWDAANNMYGHMHKPATAKRFQEEAERLDRRMLAQSCPWDTTERNADLAKPGHEDRRRAVRGKRIMGGQECDD
jgi:hypothetical protein